MTVKLAAQGFGLVIVGSEILDGRVTDSHFATARDLLKARHLEFRYAQVLPDEPAMIDAQLRWCMGRPEPFFCCGGIGTTPDDHTRQCAARVTGRALRLHPEGLDILKRKFGERATPARLRLVEFPEGAALIPNPYNQVPGFRLANGFFLPGFPEMASPMMAWILDTLFAPGVERLAVRLVLPGAREADLTELMETFVAAHGNISFSSLPRFVSGGTEIQLGLSGPRPPVEAGLADLKAALRAAGVTFEEPAP